MYTESLWKSGDVYPLGFGFFLSLSIMFSMFIHIVACVRTSFVFMAEYYSTVNACHLSVTLMYLVYQFIC